MSGSQRFDLCVLNNNAVSLSANYITATGLLALLSCWWACAPGSSLCRGNLSRDAHVSRTHVCVGTLFSFLASFPETAENVQSSRHVLKHSFCARCVIFAILTPSREDGKVCFPTCLSVMLGIGVLSANSRDATRASSGLRRFVHASVQLEQGLLFNY